MPAVQVVPARLQPARGAFDAYPHLPVAALRLAADGLRAAGARPQSGHWSLMAAATFAIIDGGTLMPARNWALPFGLLESWERRHVQHVALGHPCALRHPDGTAEAVSVFGTSQSQQTVSLNRLALPSSPTQAFFRLVSPGLSADTSAAVWLAARRRVRSCTRRTSRGARRTPCGGAATPCGSRPRYRCASPADAHAPGVEHEQLRGVIQPPHPCAVLETQPSPSP